MRWMEKWRKAFAGIFAASACAEEKAGELLYLGHGSLRVVTAEGKVMYIDPFAGKDEAYALPADYILMSHDHFDHTAAARIREKHPGCQIISWKEALQGGVHRTFTLPEVTIEAVEAGNNKNHDLHSCVGFVLTFSNGCRVYVSGDTSETRQMHAMKAMHIDYAFFGCDGVYNMGLEEAARCAELVGARKNIPYHNETAGDSYMFNKEAALQFKGPNRLILEPGDVLELK